MYILNLTMPEVDVDVNVHPAKTEVKFANEEEILREINLTITKTLNNYNLQTSPVLNFNYKFINEYKNFFGIYQNNITPEYSYEYGNDFICCIYKHSCIYRNICNM